MSLCVVEVGHLDHQPVVRLLVLGPPDHGRAHIKALPARHVVVHQTRVQQARNGLSALRQRLHHFVNVYPVEAPLPRRARLLHLLPVQPQLCRGDHLVFRHAAEVEDEADPGRLAGTRDALQVLWRGAGQGGSGKRESKQEHVSLGAPSRGPQHRTHASPARSRRHLSAPHASLRPDPSCSLALRMPVPRAGHPCLLSPPFRKAFPPSLPYPKSLQNHLPGEVRCHRAQRCLVTGRRGQGEKEKQIPRQ